MQKSSINYNSKFAFELMQLVGNKNCLYKSGRIMAFVPIRIQDGISRYKLKLVFGNKGLFDAYIVEPKIKKVNGENPPHVYWWSSKWNDERQEYDELKLCLYLPGNDEYTKRDKLVETVIAWAIKWTEFYEIWLLTGEWYGGGEHPLSIDDKEAKEKKAT